MIFYRSNHTSLVITLTSDEPLGVLDSDYIEDYNGVDGQLSIFNISTLDRVGLVMVEVPTTTPTINNDVFTGSKLLSILPDGDYQIQGRVRDLVGNYTILSGFSNPIGNEKVIPLTFSIEGGQVILRPDGLYTVSNENRVYCSKEEQRIYPSEPENRLYIAEQETRKYTPKKEVRIYG